jgi:hypothetical protein
VEETRCPNASASISLLIRSSRKEGNFTHSIEALQTYNGNETSLFLAGGITGCPDWQKEMIEKKNVLEKE